MQEPQSPRKMAKLLRSEARAGKAIASKNAKEALAPKDCVKTPGWSNNDIKNRPPDEPKDPGSLRSPGATSQEQGHGKFRRLTGRSSPGEKGKGGKPQQQQAQGSNAGKNPPPSGTENLGTTKGPAQLLQLSVEENKSTKDTYDKEDKTRSEDAAGQLAETPSLEKPVGAVEVIDESNLTTEQQLGLKQAEERLVRDYIHRLLKRLPEYPNFQYLCKLCSVHIENIQAAHKHIKEKRHKKNIMEKQEENELRALPPPSPSQLQAVNAAVLEAAKQQGISQEDHAVRQGVVLTMEEIIKQQLSACSLRLYGSCLTRFAFKTSDVNIDVMFPSNMTQPDVLIQVLEILKSSTQYTDVESDFHAKVPVVFCRDVSSGLMCKVSAGNDVACLTTNLLAALAKLEPRLVPLVLAFRYWARLCHIDCQAEGGIPSYSFALMVIFFLQQRKEPILPVYLGSWMEGFDMKQVDEYHLKGIEKDRFVLWEHRPSTSGESKNAGKAKAEQKKSAAKKPETLDSNGWQGKPKSGRIPLTLESRPEVSLGQLWLELLRFYTLEFALEEHIISIRLQELLSREIKNWPKRRLAIEDPFALKRNVARSLNSQMVFEYILERFRTAYKYFACPQSRDDTTKGQERGGRWEKPRAKGTSRQPQAGTRSKGGTPDNKEGKGTEPRLREMEEEEDTDDEEDEEGVLSDEDYTPEGVLLPESFMDLDLTDREEGLSETTQGNFAQTTAPRLKGKAGSRGGDGVRSLRSDLAGSPEDGPAGESGVAPLREHGQEGYLAGGSLSTSLNGSAENGLLESDEEERDDKGETPNVPEDLYYVFDRIIFTGGKPPTVVCSICKRDGHLKDECPEDFKKIDLKPLPPMTARFREILDGLCRMCYNELSPRLEEQQKREHILASLERFIRKEYNDKARLCLFGSSKNGFGFRDSDLDICMTLEGHDTAEKLNSKEIIEGLAKVLKKHAGLRNILPITTAKVPIVKFEHRQSGLEGDISLYNTLAQHNTRMLATYAAIDPRVQYLGYTMKVFAKRCDIGDASRGSLSSYAYILMVLYFLQQRNPPVIPVLQEIFDGNNVPQRMVDGWNAFFFDDIEELKKRLPDLGQNSESVGELWLGLLRFYTEEFDFKEYVISIRQKKLLTTFEKQWTSKCIAIEDPFDLNHNLGAGVSRKMTNFIMKAFINGRKLFGTPFYPQPGMEADYFFDSKVLTDGELAPNDRCCRICGKIGHYMKDCPKRRRMKKKENEKDDDVKEEEREPRERRCFQCGDTGHVRRDCPEYRQLRQRSAAGPVPQMMRTMATSQSIPVPQPVAASQDRPGRTRQSSECSETRQTPPYSPQPTPFSQCTSQPACSPQSQAGGGSSQAKAPGPPKQHPQVQLPLFSFHPSHAGQYHPGLPALGLLQSHQQQHHPVPIPSTSWPIHGPVLQASAAAGHPSPPGLSFSLRSTPSNGSSGSPSNTSPMSLNDPSIIFAQPAGRPLGLPPGAGREGPWHNHLSPGALVGNGTMGKSDQGFQGQFGKATQGSLPWDHSNPGHYSLSASWPYRMPQSFLQQGNGGFQQNKPFITQGTVMHSNQHFPLLQHRRHHANLNYIQQKK
nr:PREDICTED: terminal uridylyltransferase 4 [Lepisosteus oculatus]XP_015211116.1 PREDICTED: terminal uridylyltransferase 4 [Lepisosteus oculatus]